MEAYLNETLVHKFSCGQGEVDSFDRFRHELNSTLEILNTEKLVRKCVDNVTCEKIRKRLIVGQARVVSLTEKDLRKVFLQQQKCDFNKELCDNEQIVKVSSS